MNSIYFLWLFVYVHNGAFYIPNYTRLHRHQRGEVSNRGTFPWPECICLKSE